MTTRFLAFILVAVISFWAFSGFSAEESAAHRQGKKELINADIAVKRTIVKTATSVDVALAGEYSDRTPNRTHIVFRNQVTWPEGGPFGITPHFDVQLSLKNLERKWRLKFITYDQDQESRGINENRLKTEPIRDDYGGGLVLVHKLGNVLTEFQPRLEYRNSSFQTSYNLKFTSTADMGYLIFHPQSQLFARSDSGAGEFLSLNLEIPIYKTLFFGLINEEQYIDQDDIFSTNHGISVGYQFTDIVSHVFTLLYESSSRPNFHLDRYSVAMAITHRVWPNIIHYTLMPYLAFPRNLDYKVSPGVNFELDIIF